MYVEKIDVGEPEPRSIASGIRAYYPTADTLEGRQVLVVCNLKAAKLAGFPSNGMVLCGSSEDRSVVEFVDPPPQSSIGERVVCEGMIGEIASPNQVKKKKLMEAAASELKAVDGVAKYLGVPLTTSGGECTLPTIRSGTIS